MKRRTFLGGTAATLGLAWLGSVPGPAWGDVDPWVRLHPGEFYFRHRGHRAFILGRNTLGKTPEDFLPYFVEAQQSGEHLSRVHLTLGMVPNARAGDLDETWAGGWDQIFAMAASHGISILPVFTAWALWNDGSRREPFHRWDRNPYNAALGGPAQHPIALLRDSPCRKLWLGWVRKCVQRWQTRPNILGWEIFSEVNLMTGYDPTYVAGFLEAAAETIRSADPQRRPVTAAMSGVNDDPAVYGSTALDFTQLHPYQANLDDIILETVRQRRTRYRKPVLLAESGLSFTLRGSGPSLDPRPRALYGIRHAMWAAAVSGGMSGRMLWWEDGHDVQFQQDFHTRYADTDKPVADFVKDVDYAGFEPVSVRTGPNLKGAALGTERQVLAWFRDSQCVAPHWPLRPLDGRSVDIVAPGTAPSWKLSFYHTGTGAFMQQATCQRVNDTVHVPLPNFSGAIAFKMVPG